VCFLIVGAVIALHSGASVSRVCSVTTSNDYYPVCITCVNDYFPVITTSDTRAYEVETFEETAPRQRTGKRLVFTTAPPARRLSVGTSDAPDVFAEEERTKEAEWLKEKDAQDVSEQKVVLKSAIPRRNLGV
jgi:hypothetical protein